MTLLLDKRTNLVLGFAHCAGLVRSFCDEGDFGTHSAALCRHIAAVDELAECAGQPDRLGELSDVLCDHLRRGFASRGEVDVVEYRDTRIECVAFNALHRSASLERQFKRGSVAFGRKRLDFLDDKIGDCTVSDVWKRRVDAIQVDV